MPLFAVTSSSCGTGRAVHLTALAPGGGGGGCGWPPCAHVIAAERCKSNPMRKTLSSEVFVKSLRGWSVTVAPSARLRGLPSDGARSTRDFLLSVPCKFAARDPHPRRAILCGTPPATGNERSQFAEVRAPRPPAAPQLP